MFFTFLLTPPRHPGVNADANGQRWQAQLLELFVQRPQGLRIDRDQWPQWDQWPPKKTWVDVHQSKIHGFHMFWSDLTLIIHWRIFSRTESRKMWILSWFNLIWSRKLKGLPNIGLVPDIHTWKCVGNRQELMFHRLMFHPFIDHSNWWNPSFSGRKMTQIGNYHLVMTNIAMENHHF